jgi:YbgC/YbaW family acyl-CoA thioester hydrolase
METFRTVVAPENCDHLGHMNVQHYFAVVSDGMFALMVHLGLGPDEIRRRQMSFAVVRAETDFHRELHAGDLIVLESSIIKFGDKSATFRHRLTNASGGVIAMSTEFKCVLLDLEKRQAMQIPEDIRAAAVRLMD